MLEVELSKSILFFIIEILIILDMVLGVVDVKANVLRCVLRFILSSKVINGSPGIISMLYKSCKFINKNFPIL